MRSPLLSVRNLIFALAALLSVVPCWATGSSSMSRWQARVASDWLPAADPSGSHDTNWASRSRVVLEASKTLAREFGDKSAEAEIARIRRRISGGATGSAAQKEYLRSRMLQRELALKNPLLKDFDVLLFTKRVPGSYSHMCDQYYGWWSRPGGGVFLLRDFKGPSPKEECLTASFKEPGSFLRPDLSYDGRKVLFAWCRFYEGLAAHTNKVDKANIPEDAFYHLFEIDIDGSNLRQLTRGKYDDFDGRYLPDGRIVFTSTRRGQSVRPGVQIGSATMDRPDFPDSYMRCGGGADRPVPVFTLHVMGADGSAVSPISPFEMFEWNPEVSSDGGILYARWDCIDRDNTPFVSLWTINPDGSNARSIYKNYTRSPYCVFEPRAVPGTSKIVFTASAHHARTMGSLVLLDPTSGTEGVEPIRRLTPEVDFPEAEGWPQSYYSSPWPLSERSYLVAWGKCEGRIGSAQAKRWDATNDSALYLYDAELRSRELLWADDKIGCTDPIPVRSRPRPPIVATQLVQDAEKEGAFLGADVYRGLTNVQRGEIKALRVVGIPSKTDPVRNSPQIGLTMDDPGKYVLGTVPVEPDGSAYFNVPGGVTVFFQALDSRGVAVQTMRSATHVQPGQTLGCIGCHEHRHEAPAIRALAASARPPSSLSPGPRGSWPLRYDRLVQPVLNWNCIRCHNSESTNALARRIDLTPEKSYDVLVKFGKPNLAEQVRETYSRSVSIPHEGIAEKSALVALLAPGHHEVDIDREGWDRLLTWLDTYAQRQGHFSEQQEDDIDEFRRASAHLFGRRNLLRGPMLNAR